LQAGIRQAIGELPMNIIMHLLFSYDMRRIIRKHSGVKLNLVGFMYGNILPDIKAIHKPHRINGSLTFVVKRARRLMEEPYQRCSIYSWSKKLGIITHYLSDYFCYAHQEHYDKGIGKHMLYEMRMIVQYRKGRKQYMTKFGKAYHRLAPDEFERWILEQNRQYNSQPCSHAGDISHALYAGTMIGKSILHYRPVWTKPKKAQHAVPVSSG